VSVDLRDYGAKADGVTDAAPAFTAARRVSAHIYVPPGDYAVKSLLALPRATRIEGGGKYNTRLLHAHGGDFATLAEGVGISELTIEGQGARHPGRGLVLGGYDGKQYLNAVAVVGFDGYCIDFETVTAGSQFRAAQVDVARTSAGSGTGRYAIHVAHGRQLAAVPRSFVQLETQGTCAIDFGGCNDMYVTASTIGDLAFTAESRGVNIAASRLLNQLALTIAGQAVTIVGCDIAAQLTIAPGSSHVVVAPNAFNRLPVIDNSGNKRNQLPPTYPA
jgi:hypothetical protein